VHVDVEAVLGADDVAEQPSVIDGSLPDAAISDMIEDSYDLVVSKLPPARRRSLGLCGEAE
jgi:hypothetical protein